MVDTDLINRTPRGDSYGPPGAPRSATGRFTEYDAIATLTSHQLRHFYASVLLTNPTLSPVGIARVLGMPTPTCLQHLRPLVQRRRKGRGGVAGHLVLLAHAHGHRRPHQEYGLSRSFKSRATSIDVALGVLRSA